jgi:hypothetical protein
METQMESQFGMSIVRGQKLGEAKPQTHLETRPSSVWQGLQLLATYPTRDAKLEESKRCQPANPDPWVLVLVVFPGGLYLMPSCCPVVE